MYCILQQASEEKGVLPNTVFELVGEGKEGREAREGREGREDSLASVINIIQVWK